MMYIDSTNSAVSREYASVALIKKNVRNDSETIEKIYLDKYTS